MGGLLRQLRLLLWKNFILQIRRPVGTAVEITLPVLFTAVLIIAKVALKVNEECFDTFQPSLTKDFARDAVRGQMNRIGDCNKGVCKRNVTMSDITSGNKSLHLAYYPVNALTTQIIQKISTQLFLKPQSKDSFGKEFSSEDVAAKEASEFYDKFFGAVIFEFDSKTTALPKKVRYKIRLSHRIPTIGQRSARGSWRTNRNYPFFNDPGARTENYYANYFLPLQYLMDKTIAEMQLTGKNLSHSSAADAIQQFPYPNYTKNPFIDTVQAMMPLLFVLAFVYTAVSIIKELVAEKESRLKESMKMMGLANWLHWFAWFLKNFLFLLITIILLTALCKGAKIFEHSNWSLILIFFLCFILATIFSCFLVSAFFSNAIRAMLFGATLWIGSLAPYLSFSNPESYETLSRGAKMASCLLPNTCFGIGVQVITRFEKSTEGAQWSTIGDPASVDDNISLGHVFMMLIIDSILFWILTWYIEGVFPGDYGVPKPFYFPFLPSYWCGTISENTISFKDEGRADEKNPNVEEETSGAEVGVGIQKLRKVFKGATGKKVAVDDLSLDIYKGQITALLGHNGAGKTTTMSILTGLFPPSGGAAHINGKSIATEMEAIRGSLGLCPQHNVLFDRLTVKEHLEFFAALKGVSGSNAKQQITDMIADMQLVEKTNQQSTTLSGGMKRKLSCAIALIGGSKIVFLDEPTSGMDPYARRATWDLLQKHRQGRTIILTTHFMDEADYLGDRIAIMADGKLKCCGSSLFLKKRFGVGYHMVLVKGTGFQENAVIRAIHDAIPNASIASNVGSEMAFVLEHDSSKYFKPLFQKLEAEQQELGISSFGVSITTMEEVFLKVGEGTDQTIDELQEADAKKKAEHSILVNGVEKKPALLTGGALKAAQFKALFIKRFLNSKREKKALITQILLPLLLTFFGLILSNTSPTQEDDKALTMQLRHLYDSKNPTKAIYSDFRTVSANNSERSNFQKVAKDYYADDKVELMDVLTASNALKTGNTGSSIKTKDKTYTIGIDRKECCNFKFLVVNDVCQKAIFNAESYKRVCGSSTTFGYHHCTKCLAGPQRLNPSCPAAVPETNLTDSLTFYKQHVLQQSDVKRYFNIHAAGMTVNDKNGKSFVTSWYSNEGLHNVAEGFSATNNILLKSGMNDDSYGIITTNHPLPRSASEKVDLASANFGNLSLITFVSMAACFICASFVTFLVAERVSKAKHIQFVSGVDSVIYWTSNFTWDYLNYLVPAAGIFILFAAFQLTGYTGKELGDVFLVLLLFGLSVLPFVYLLSFVFTSSLIAYSVVALFLMILSLGMVIAVFVCSIKSLELEKEANIMHHIFLLLPTYAFPQALADISTNVGARDACSASERTKMGCIASNTVWHESSLNWDRPGIGSHCLFMAIEAIVYFILTLLVENNFFIKRKSNGGASSSAGPPEDVDVVAERERVKKMDQKSISQEAVVMKDLTKIYPGSTAVAVDHLSLGIPKGECFGLLGVNGAGKTTTFGMLTGEHNITKGTAFLGGYDIRTNLKQVQQRIGYCPQFDALVERLTAREMLTMFARLRGIQEGGINTVVSDVIEKLNLGKWADKMCGTYSGGNKRKLSTALALVGDPPIIFLDEPTSGMDPASRRFLWNALTQLLNKDRSIVLTSHSMEECEALCTRLVIMVNGKFKCVGSIQHLKSRFGQGYTLMIKVESGSSTEADRRTRNIERTLSLPVIEDANGNSANESTFQNANESYTESQVQSNGTSKQNLNANGILNVKSMRGAEINIGFEPDKSKKSSNGLVPPQGLPLSSSNINLYESMNKVKDFVTRNFSGAMLLEDRLGLLEYQVINPNLTWSFMFGTLEENAEALGIVDYSISQTSLEQVFINFAKEQHSEERNQVRKFCTCSCF